MTCGGGTLQKVRTCSAPPASNGGQDCDGNDVEAEDCNMDPCPGICPCIQFRLFDNHPMLNKANNFCFVIVITAYHSYAAMVWKK